MGSESGRTVSEVTEALKADLGPNGHRVADVNLIYEGDGEAGKGQRLRDFGSELVQVCGDLVSIDDDPYPSMLEAVRADIERGTDR